jgi:hypothetical protein
MTCCKHIAEPPERNRDLVISKRRHLEAKRFGRHEPSMASVFDHRAEVRQHVLSSFATFRAHESRSLWVRVCEWYTRK